MKENMMSDDFKEENKGKQKKLKDTDFSSFHYD